MLNAIELGGEFFDVLTTIDEKIVERVAEGGCAYCGGPLYRGDYPRKPRGGLIAEAASAFESRFSLCCGRDGCRKRATPPSVRFPWPTRLCRRRGDCGQHRRPAHHNGSRDTADDWNRVAHGAPVARMVAWAVYGDLGVHRDLRSHGARPSTTRAARVAARWIARRGYGAGGKAARDARTDHDDVGRRWITIREGRDVVARHAIVRAEDGATLI